MFSLAVAKCDLAKAKGVAKHFRDKYDTVLKEIEGPAKDSTTTQETLESYLLELNGVPEEGKANVEGMNEALNSFNRGVESLDWVENEAGMKECKTMSTDGENDLIALSTLVNGLDRLYKTVKLGLDMKRQAKETQLATARPVAGTTIVVNQPTAIPTFDGTVEKFAEFWQIFIHIVDSDPHLAKIEKLSRLMAALKGDARATLASILVHEDNYELAKTKLLAEYGSDAKVIILLHKALEKKTANSGRPKDQKTLYFEIEGVTTQLLARSQQLDSPLITVQILNKFSNDVRRRINGKTVDDPLLLSNFDKFMKALKRVIEILIAESGDKDHPKGVNSSNVNAFQTGNRAQNNPKNQHQQDKKDAYPITNPPKGGVCAFCKSPEHFSWYCSNVKDIKRRREILIAEARCFRCFKIGHNSNNCTRGPCHTCQGDHNAVVCYKNAASKGNPSKEANSNSQQSANKPRAKGNWNGKFKGKPKGKAQTHHVKAEEPDHEPVQEAQTNHVARLNMKAILPVAQADVRKTANSKQSISVTVLLDTASDTTFISNGLAKKMGLHQGESKRMSMRVFGQERKYIDYPVFKFVLTHGEGKEMGKIPIEAFGSDTLTGDLSVGVLTREDMNFIRKRHVKLALPRSSGDSCTPDILLGQDQLDEVWDETRRPLRLPSGSWLIPTIFGYVRMGKAPVRRSRGTSESTVSQILVNAIQLAEEETEESAVTQIIVNTVESMRIPDYTPSFEEFTGTSKEEKEAMEKAVWKEFEQTIQKERISDGTCVYSVRLPWIPTQERLPSNRSIALHRLSAKMNGPKRDINLLQQMDAVFQDQIDKGILEDVDETKAPDGPRVHYIASQAVLTPEKSTKVRVVFDASAKYSSEPSLNMMLHPGPTILPLLAANLLRFRMAKYILIADLEKAFLQVRLQLIDRDACRTLWVRDVNKPLSEENLRVLRFTRVTFGLTSAPFLLAGTIQFHIRNSTLLPEDLRQELLQNLYVDNVLVSGETEDEVFRKYELLKQVFLEFGMNLRQFSTNSAETMRRIKEGDREDQTTVKMLGIDWDIEKDQIMVRSPKSMKTVLTKRDVSSAIGSVFDPQGFLSANLLPAKVFLHDLWEAEVGWDTVLPDEKISEWKLIWDSIKKAKVKLRRLAANLDRKLPAQLVVFSDASSIALGCAVYLRQSKECDLLIGKSKVPKKGAKFTIPKLELAGLTMAVQTAEFVIGSLVTMVRIDEIAVLTDSEIVIGWIRREPMPKDGTFIRNRFLEIREIVMRLKGKGVKVRFGHTPGQTNPADICTRPDLEVDLEKAGWWHGPQFCLDPFDSMNLAEIAEGLHEYPEAMIMAIRMEDDQNELIDLSRFSTMSKAIRVMVLVWKFVRHIIHRMPKPMKEARLRRHPNLTLKSESFISCAEQREARTQLYLAHQSEPVTRRYIESKMKENHVGFDSQGVARVISRMQEADLDESSKCAIIIRPRSEMARLLIQEVHDEYHPNAQHTMNVLRESFDMGHNQGQVVAYVRDCVRCRRWNSPPFRCPDMANLPPRRVQKARPFQDIGLDNFGPIMVIDKGEQSKAYGLLLTCTRTRLVHIEVVPDLSALSFINALKRFFARRGVPHTITSDNAPNFSLGEEVFAEAAEAFRRLQKSSEVRDVLLHYEAEWKHTTPYAPWQGGWWERFMKTVKSALYKTIGRSIVATDTLATLLTEIEAMVNSRPLTYHGSQIEDILRPVDFIMPRINLMFPMGDREDDRDRYLPSSGLSTKELAEEALAIRERLAKKYWDKWSNDYLLELRDSHKRRMNRARGSAVKPKVGMVVLMNDPNQPRNHWKLAVITKLTPSVDGEVRKAEIRVGKTKTVTERPVNLLTPLEFDGIEEQTAEVVEPSVETVKDAKGTVDSKEPEKPRYDLRPRKKRSYEEDDSESQNGSSMNITAKITKNLAMLSLLILFFFGIPVAEAFSTKRQDQNEVRVNGTRGILRCIEGGAEALLVGISEYTLCVGSICRTNHNPEVLEKYYFLPEVVTREYRVRLKKALNDVHILEEIRCPAIEFCKAVRCTMCLDNLLNPTCWPWGNIFMYAFILLMAILGLYLVCTQPVVIGDVIRFVGSIFLRIAKAPWRIFWCCFKGSRVASKWISRKCRRNRRKEEVEEELIEATLSEIVVRPAREGGAKPRNLKFALNMAIIMTLITSSMSCVEINLMDRQHVNCMEMPGDYEKCTVQFQSELHIDWLQWHGCVVAKYNNTKIAEVRLAWENSTSSCLPETKGFTRNVVESRELSTECFSECPANEDLIEGLATTTTELHPQAEVVAKCRMNLCETVRDLFAVSHLINWPKGREIGTYTISPSDDQIYAVEQCQSWSTEVTMKAQSYVLGDLPKLRHIRFSDKTTANLGPFRIELKSSDTEESIGHKVFFRRNKTDRVIWDKPYPVPKLFCSSEEKAERFEHCELAPRCRCKDYVFDPCDECKETNPEELFTHTEHRLPTGLEDFWFKEESGMILAESEKVEFSILSIRLNAIIPLKEIVGTYDCSAKIDSVTGCYSCPRAAKMIVTCSSEQKETAAHLKCGHDDFALLCAPGGVANDLLLLRNQSELSEECRLSCGKIDIPVELKAELHYVPPRWNEVKKEFWRKETKRDPIQSILATNWSELIPSLDASRLVDPAAVIDSAKELIRTGKEGIDKVVDSVSSHVDEIKKKMMPDWLRILWFIWDRKGLFLLNLILLAIIVGFAWYNPTAFFGGIGKAALWLGKTTLKVINWTLKFSFKRITEGFNKCRRMLKRGKDKFA